MRRASSVEATAPYALAAAVALAYVVTLTAPVFGDDRRFIENAPFLLLPFTDFIRGLFSRDYLFLTGEGTYQPLVTFFHYLTHGHPAVYRAFGVMLHAVNACLVYRVALRLKAAPVSALLAAMLFALFPAHTELLIISSFKGTLFAFAFSLAALLCWMSALDKGSLRSVGGAFFFFALALASKETGVLIPGLLAAYSLLFARRKYPDLQRRAGLGLALMASCYLFWRFRGLERISDPATPHSPLLLFGWYLKTLAWPHPLCRERLAPEGPSWYAFCGFFLLALWGARRRPEVLFGLLLLALGLLPVLQRAQTYMDSPVADRYVYFSSAGFALALGLVARGPAVTATLATLALIWGGLTVQRNLLYRNTRALYEQTVVCAPGHFKAWGVLAENQLNSGELAAAQASSRKAVTLNPYYPGALKIWALSSFRLEDYNQAREAVRLELQLFPSEMLQMRLDDLKRYPATLRNSSREE